MLCIIQSSAPKNEELRSKRMMLGTLLSGPNKETAGSLEA
jgi:hypothetical protein